MWRLRLQAYAFSACRAILGDSITARLFAPTAEQKRRRSAAIEAMIVADLERRRAAGEDVAAAEQAYLRARAEIRAARRERGEPE